MAWFDGTFETEKEKLADEFPIIVTDDLRLNHDKTKMAVINRFEKNDALYHLSDPHLEKGVYHSEEFYHTFVGNSADKARTAVEQFTANGFGTGEYEVILLRKENGNLFQYGYGELHPESEIPADVTAQLPKTADNKSVYILPLAIYGFPCPVCKHRTLQYRGMFEICEVCGWEDEGTDDEDEESPFGANGDYSIKTYRQEYERQFQQILDVVFEDLAKEKKKDS